MAIDPARFGMPDATTTGVQPGITLKPYTGPMIVTTDGAVIENVIINGTLTVEADNVTIRNCVIQNFSNWGLLSERRQRTSCGVQRVQRRRFDKDLRHGHR